ncbi:conserved hypothetical [Prochlorococcus marinus str. MIT 9313]|uniref:Conserved hypothetical n=1 Tax=Prochlorococcus marinus (strain MIT 9313) TaxID=74547 RepID=Q7V8A4_PROMM|nr:hypothetical protein [Prochlorococcus marinus]KZR68999.1 hypothetical protein PMIT1313_01457 [Prochlorococcus marinus str. MIT 1313]KZR71983.1 hypothetical protein PMIT1318_01793 [Prochlorococcus marinus str. MIT 1318]CAE20633.1 conserved hypothetical [Prochlorococcus marinus str. MIT 9313]
MSGWSGQVEDELTLLLKDWLKQQGRTQADLRRSLQAVSTRMPALLEVLEREHRLGGIPRVAARLCEIEAEWVGTNALSQSDNQKDADPFSQLDLLLQEIRDDCGS